MAAKFYPLYILYNYYFIDITNSKIHTNTITVSSVVKRDNTITVSSVVKRDNTITVSSVVEHNNTITVSSVVRHKNPPVCGRQENT